MIYEPADAEKFISERTGSSPQNVRCFLERRFRFQELMGLCEGYFSTEEEAETERGFHSDLLTEGREDQNNVVQYVLRTTSLSRSTVAAMYAEEVGYEVTLGIMEAGAYPYFRSWADAIAEEEKEAEDALPVN